MRILYFCPAVSSLFLSFFSPNLSRRRSDVSETCCTRLAGKAGSKKSPKIRHRGTNLSDSIFATKARICNWKKLVKQQYLRTYFYNMVKFDPLAPEICWRVWGTPANFNGFHVLAALLHGTRAMGVSQPNFAARYKERNYGTFGTRSNHNRQACPPHVVQW